MIRWCCPASIGRRKPDGSIFYYAARLANLPTSDCIYVGDSIVQDIRGACRAGFRYAIQIRNEYADCEECGDDDRVAPDAVIDHMDELLLFLEDELHVMQAIRGSGKGAPRKIRALLFDAGDILYYRPGREKRWRAFCKSSVSVRPACLLWIKWRLKSKRCSAN